MVKQRSNALQASGAIRSDQDGNPVATTIRSGLIGLRAMQRRIGLQGRRDSGR